MDLTQLDDDQLDQLAADLAPRLPTGTHGDRVVLSRRQFAAAATGTLGVGALMALGVDEASAQAAGQVGTSSSPVDVYGYSVDVANELVDASDTSHTGALADASDVPTVSSTSTTSGYEITINGDTYQFNV